MLKPVVTSSGPAHNLGLLDLDVFLFVVEKRIDLVLSSPELMLNLLSTGRYDLYHSKTSRRNPTDGIFRSEILWPIVLNEGLLRRPESKPFIS